MSFLRIAVSLFVILTPLCVFASEARRVALVIGNSSYQTVEALKNPVNDANDIAAALSRIGFEVTLSLDANGEEMRRSLKQFANQSQKAELSLLYFAGHGIEIDKKNYLIPVNAQLSQNQDVAFEAIPLDTVIGAIAESEGVKIVLVDACRNNPFATRLKSAAGSRSIGIGLSRVDPVGGVIPGGIIVSYAAREGTFALDGKGRNSPYAKGLLENIEKPGLEVGKLFREVRDRVYKLTGGQQEPFTYGSLPASDIFLLPVNSGAPVSGFSGVPESSEALAEFYRAEWQNTPVAWRDFILKFSESESDNELVEIAKRRLVSLGADAMLRTLEKDGEPWLVPDAGLPPRGSVTLNIGERKLVQKALMYMGHDLGAIDGKFGIKTRNAIVAFRLNIGLTPSVDVDVNLLRRLPNVIKIDRLKSREARKIAVPQNAADLEPRLAKALAVLKEQKIIFDYFRGHLYIAVNSELIGWKLSHDLAKKAGGYLVTISDREENEFVYNLFQSDDLFFPRKMPGYRHGPHIGLVQADRSNEPGGGWTWVTGEDLRYSNWGTGSPNNHNNSAHYGRFAGEGARLNRWSDSRGTGGTFVMEVD